MQFRVLMSVIVAASFVLVSGPARATSTYQYRENECVIIGDGLAPSKKLSIAAHGGGEDGGDDLHVWLMAEPAHKRRAILENMTCSDNGGSGSCLDSGADAYNAVWSTGFAPCRGVVPHQP